MLLWEAFWWSCQSACFFYNGFQSGQVAMVLFGKHLLIQQHNDVLSICSLLYMLQSCLLFMASVHLPFALPDFLVCILPPYEPLVWCRYGHLVFAKDLFSECLFEKWSAYIIAFGWLCFYNYYFVGNSSRPCQLAPAISLVCNYYMCMLVEFVFPGCEVC